MGARIAEPVPEEASRTTDAANAKALLELVGLAVADVWPRDGADSDGQATAAPSTPIVRAREAVRTFIGSAASMFGGMCLRGSPLTGPSVLCVRVCCMLRGRPNAASEVESSLTQLSAADFDALCSFVQN